MKPRKFLLLPFMLTACATVPTPPIIAQINFISIETAVVQHEIIMGDYHHESFDVPGYKIRFESDREIAPPDTHPKINPFARLEYYECGSQNRPPENSHLAARDYMPAAHSGIKILEKRNNGNTIYEAQLIKDYFKTATNLCAKIFVHDGNIKRKIWQPAFISNAIEFNLPSAPENSLSQ